MNANTVSGELPGDLRELLGRTLRVVFLMVAACVIFVGALSLAAVAVASHAAHPAGPGGTMDTDTATPSVTPPGAPHAKGSNSMTPASRI